jgi:hypothetical protein
MDTMPETGRGDARPSYPAAPWTMAGQLWLSLFRVTEDVDELRTAGIYGAAFVSYEEGSELTYSELLVARPVRTQEHGRRVEIVDIWVDSPESMLGGRELWAIPKGLCDFSLETSHRGPVTGTEWSASAERRPIARASFTDVSRAALRTPFKGGTWQPSLTPGGPDRTATMQGSAKVLPCRGHWEFDPAGPLGWLAGRRRLASFRMAGFRMTFG